MDLCNRPAKPRMRRWKWQVVRRMFAAERPDLTDDELDTIAREVARQLTRLDDLRRYREWRFNSYEMTSGLEVGQLDDPTSSELDSA